MLFKFTLTAALIQIAMGAPASLQDVSAIYKAKLVNYHTNSTLRSYEVDKAVFLPVVPYAEDDSQYFDLLDAKDSSDTAWYIKSKANHGYVSANKEGNLVVTRNEKAWAFEDAGNGTYIIKAPNEDKVWTAKNIVDLYERHVLVKGVDGSDYQRWYIDF